MRRVVQARFTSEELRDFRKREELAVKGMKDDLGEQRERHRCWKNSNRSADVESQRMTAEDTGEPVA